MSERLLDRERPLAVLDRALADARGGRGGAFCIRGPAGIGKTALLRAVAERAPGPVLRCAGGRLERDHPYGAVLELVEPVLAGAAPNQALVDAAGPALVALAAGEATVASPLPPADARMSLEHGLRRLLAAIAREEPGALVIVDDLHWVDVASLRAFAHVARSIGAVGCALVLAARAEAEDEPVARELLRRVTTLDLEPLGEGAVAELVAAALPESNPAVVGGLIRAQTGGSPLLVTRLLTDLARSAAPVNELAVRAARPPEIATAVAARLDELGPDATRLAVAAAVLGDDAAQLRRAAALAGLKLDVAVSEAGRLAAADVLVPGDPLRFAHPLVAAAALERLQATERAAAHLRAARLLYDDGARPAVVAARLLAALPSGEQWAVSALRAAGEEALAQGDPAAAARLLRRALEEGPGADERAAIALPLARAASFAGDDDAAERTEAALAAAPGATIQVMVLLDRGDALVATGRPAEARVVLDRALSLSVKEEVPAELRAYAIVAAETASWVHGRPGPVGAPAAAASRAADADGEAGFALSAAAAAAGDTPQESGARALATAAALALTGAGSEQEIAFQAMAGLTSVTGMARVGSGFLATMALGAVDQHVELAALLDEGAEWATAVGSPLATGTWAGAAGILAGWLGNLPSAADSCRQALALEADGWDRHSPAVRATLAQAELDRGRVDAARDALGGPELRARVVGRIDYPVLLIAQARLASGDEAIEILRVAGSAAEAMGARSPVLMPWRAALALALDRSEPDEARAVADEQTALATRLGTRRARGVALRVSGLLDRDPDQLCEASEILADSPARLEHARAELALGEVLRRAGHRIDSREHFHAAIAIADDCGADALVIRAREELNAAGGRDRRGAGDALTPAERRVAELAAAGASNPEIAERLFLGRRTVEMHLSRSYRKLGIAGRSELAGRLEGEGV